MYLEIPPVRLKPHRLSGWSEGFTTTPNGKLSSEKRSHDVDDFFADTHIIAPDFSDSEQYIDVCSSPNLLPLTRSEEINTMNTSEDEPLSGLNGRLRPRKSNVPSSQKKISKNIEGKAASDKPKRTSTPSKASPSKPDDLANKSDPIPATQCLCPYCDRKFASKQTVSKHARRIHLSASKQDEFISCLFCNHNEAEGNNIIRHMVDSHPNQYFACLDCHTRFASTSELAEHKLNVCEKQKPYRSKLRQKSSSGVKKDSKSLRKNEYLAEKEYSDGRGFNGIVISCELKPSQIHDDADIEDNITTNLILPRSKSLGHNPVIEKNAVIVLDDIQWNKRIPSNFSFHNTDADQILSRLGVVHRSPRTGESTRKEWFKTEDSVQKFERCFDTSFYSKVASNVQENLAKCLDGSFNFNPDLENTIKTRKSKNSVVINTAEGFPILLAFEQYSRNVYDSYMPRAIAPKHKWKWDSLENDKILMNPDQIKRDSHANNCIITLVSSLDIWTQLCMRRKYEHKFRISNIEKKIEKRNIIDKELKEILESREIPSTSSQLVKYSDKTITTRNYPDFPATLGLMPSTPISELQSAVLSGEWVRPRCYVCCACGAQTRDGRALTSHISIQHPNAQVQHYEIVGESLLNADIMKHLYVPPTQVSNRTRPLRGFRDCTKCKKSITLEELHQHMLDCAGDTPAVRRKCRSRPFGVRKRRPRVPDNMLRRKLRKDLRNRHKQKTVMRPQPKIRTEVGDAETIRKMIADLPAKRHRVVINPMNSSLRSRNKHDKQRSKLMIKRRTSEDPKSRRLRAIKEMNLNKSAESATMNKNSQNNTSSPTGDEDDIPLKPKKRIPEKNTRQTNTLKRKPVVNRPKRKIQMKNQNSAKLPEQDNATSKDSSQKKDFFGNDRTDRINDNNSQNNSRQNSGRGGNGNRRNEGANDRENDSSNGRQNSNINNNNNNNNNNDGGQGQNAPAPLKHSIASLTADTETHDKSVQFHRLFLMQQECNSLTDTRQLQSEQKQMFENEETEYRLDKPPLTSKQKVSIDPSLQKLDLKNKGQQQKSRKGLNDCIAMLKNKLVDPIPTGQSSVQCGSDDPIEPDPGFYLSGPVIDSDIDPKPAEVYSRSLFSHGSIVERPPTQMLSDACERQTLLNQEISVSKMPTEGTISTLSHTEVNVPKNILPSMKQDEVTSKRKSNRLRSSLRIGEHQLFESPSQIDINPQINIETTKQNINTSNTIGHDPRISLNSGHMGPLQNVVETPKKIKSIPETEHHYQEMVPQGVVVSKTTLKEQRSPSRPSEDRKSIPVRKPLYERGGHNEQVAVVERSSTSEKLPFQDPLITDHISKSYRPLAEQILLTEPRALMPDSRAFLEPRLYPEHLLFSGQMGYPERGVLTEQAMAERRIYPEQISLDQMAYADQRLYAEQRSFLESRIYPAHRILSEQSYVEQRAYPDPRSFAEHRQYPESGLMHGKNTTELKKLSEQRPLSNRRSSKEQKALAEAERRLSIEQWQQMDQRFAKERKAKEAKISSEQKNYERRSYELRSSQARKKISQTQRQQERRTPVRDQEQWPVHDQRMTSLEQVPSFEQKLLDGRRTSHESKTGQERGQSRELRLSQEQKQLHVPTLLHEHRGPHELRGYLEQKSPRERTQELQNELMALHKQRILHEHMALYEQQTLYNQIHIREQRSPRESRTQRELMSFFEQRDQEQRILNEQRNLQEVRTQNEQRLIHEQRLAKQKFQQEANSHHTIGMLQDNSDKFQVHASTLVQKSQQKFNSQQLHTPLIQFRTRQDKNTAEHMLLPEKSPLHDRSNTPDRIIHEQPIQYENIAEKEPQLHDPDVRLKADPTNQLMPVPEIRTINISTPPYEPRPTGVQIARCESKDHIGQGRPYYQSSPHTGEIDILKQRVHRTLSGHSFENQVNNELLHDQESPVSQPPCQEEYEERDTPSRERLSKETCFDRESEKHRYTTETKPLVDQEMEKTARFEEPIRTEHLQGYSHTSRPIQKEKILNVTVEIPQAHASNVLSRADVEQSVPLDLSGKADYVPKHDLADAVINVNKTVKESNQTSGLRLFKDLPVTNTSPSTDRRNIGHFNENDDYGDLTLKNVPNPVETGTDIQTDFLHDQTSFHNHDLEVDPSIETKDICVSIDLTEDEQYLNKDNNRDKNEKHFESSLDINTTLTEKNTRSEHQKTEVAPFAKESIERSFKTQNPLDSMIHKPKFKMRALKSSATTTISGTTDIGKRISETQNSEPISESAPKGFAVRAEVSTSESTPSLFVDTSGNSPTADQLSYTLTETSLNVRQTQTSKHESTVPVYTLAKTCISVPKIGSTEPNTLTSALLSIANTTLESSKSLYTLTDMTTPISLCHSSKKQSATDIHAQEPAEPIIPKNNQNDTNKETTTASNADPDLETARKIALLPKELVEILGTMPADHRKQLLDVLPQYVSTTAESHTKIKGDETDDFSKTSVELENTSNLQLSPSETMYMYPEHQTLSSMNNPYVPNYPTSLNASPFVDSSHPMSFLLAPPPPPPLPLVPLQFLGPPPPLPPPPPPLSLAPPDPQPQLLTTAPPPPPPQQTITNVSFQQPPPSLQEDPLQLMQQPCRLTQPLLPMLQQSCTIQQMAQQLSWFHQPPPPPPPLPPASEETLQFPNLSKDEPPPSSLQHLYQLPPHQNRMALQQLPRNSQEVSRKIPSNLSQQSAPPLHPPLPTTSPPPLLEEDIKPIIVMKQENMDEYRNFEVDEKSIPMEYKNTSNESNNRHNYVDLTVNEQTSCVNLQKSTDANTKPVEFSTLEDINHSSVVKTTKLKIVNDQTASLRAVRIKTPSERKKSLTTDAQMLNKSETFAPPKSESHTSKKNESEAGNTPKELIESENTSKINEKEIIPEMLSKDTIDLVKQRVTKIVVQDSKTCAESLTDQDNLTAEDLEHFLTIKQSEDSTQLTNKQNIIFIASSPVTTKATTSTDGQLSAATAPTTVLPQEDVSVFDSTKQKCMAITLADRLEGGDDQANELSSQQSNENTELKLGSNPDQNSDDCATPVCVLTEITPEAPVKSDNTTKQYDHICEINSIAVEVAENTEETQLMILGDANDLEEDSEDDVSLAVIVKQREFLQNTSGQRYDESLDSKIDTNVKIHREGGNNLGKRTKKKRKGIKILNNEEMQFTNEKDVGGFDNVQDGIKPNAEDEKSDDGEVRISSDDLAETAKKINSKEICCQNVIKSIETCEIIKDQVVTKELNLTEHDHSCKTENDVVIAGSHDSQIKSESAVKEMIEKEINVESYDNNLKTDSLIIKPETVERQKESSIQENFSDLNNSNSPTAQVKNDINAGRVAKSESLESPDIIPVKELQPSMEDSQMISVRRSKRGKSMFVDNVSVEQENLVAATLTKTPLTKKQLIFSKLLLDGENPTNIMANSVPKIDTGVIPNCVSEDKTEIPQNCDVIIAPIQDIKKYKAAKRKSPQLKKKNKKKKMCDDSLGIGSQIDTESLKHKNKGSKHVKHSKSSNKMVKSNTKIVESDMYLTNEYVETNNQTIVQNTNKEQFTTSAEKRKLQIDSCDEKPKKTKFCDDIPSKSVNDKDEIEESSILYKGKANITESRVTCYMPSAARRTRSKSVMVKSSKAELYDPYDIDLDEMIEKAEPIERKKNISAKHITNQTSHSKTTVASCSKNKEIISDSDDSSKSDVPLKKLVEEKERKNLLSGELRKPNKKASNAKNVSSRKGNKESKKNRRTGVAINNVDDSIDTEERLRSEQFMESFGFFSERKPRKSNLLASKKISETFHVIDKDDKYFSRQSKLKRSQQNENRKCGNRVPSRLPQRVIKKRSVKRGRVTKKKIIIKPLLRVCGICKKQFRRTDNYLRHQTTLLHVSKLAEAELKTKVNPIQEQPNYLVAYRQQLKRYKKLARTFARNKKKNPKSKSKSKFKWPSADEMMAEVNKAVREQTIAQRNLSGDQALFIDCCSTEATVKGFDLLEKPNKSDGDVDSITAKNILESEEVLNMEKDLVTGFKETFQRNTSNIELNHSEDLNTRCHQPNVSTATHYDTTLNHQEGSVEEPILKDKNIPEYKEKMYPDIVEPIDMFEDKFDKIKRKCRSQAAAAKQIPTVVPLKTSYKGRKKSDKKKGKKSPRKNVQSTQVLTKGALKGFEGIKISIPTTEINMTAISPPASSNPKRKKKNSSKKKRDKKDSQSTSKPDLSNRVKENPSSQKKVDVYEFMDNEDTELFEFRPSTLMERFKSISKDTPSTSKYNPANDDLDKSESGSDEDDFVYMSDDYMCSDDETENSLLSCEMYSGKAGMDLKKTSALKRKDALEKNAVMGKIFKHNAVRTDKKSLKAKESAKVKTNLDQLFDSLLEDQPNASTIHNDSLSPKHKDLETPEDHDLSSKLVKYDDTHSNKHELSPLAVVNSPSLKRYTSPPSPYDDRHKQVNYGASTSKQADDFYPSLDQEPSMSKKRDVGLPKVSKKLSAKKLDYNSSKEYDIISKEYTSESKHIDTPTIDEPNKECELKNSPREKSSSINTSFDFIADVDDHVTYDDTGVTRQRTRRKCAVGKQNVLAETWSSESEPDGLPPRPTSAESVIISSRKKKGKKKDSGSSTSRRAKHVTFKKQHTESKTSNRNRRASSAGGSQADGDGDSGTETKLHPSPYDAPVASTSTGLGAGVGPRVRPRPASYYWSSEGDEEQEKEQPPEPEPELPQQHGWIVGDSHKKLVTMLAHAKGRKRPDENGELID